VSDKNKLKEVFKMAAKTMEERMKLLEGTVAKQNKTIQMLKDVHEVQNLMGRYIYLHEVNRDSEFPDTIYAQKTPGVSAEVATAGAYVGKGIRKMFEPMPGMPAGPMKGGLFTHPLTTPVIEIAGDGKTAKGIWISPGYETGANDPETKKPIACFCYTKYGCDFVKEDGVWKMWHYHVYRMFMTPWNVPFTDEWEKNVRDKLMGKFGAGRKPDLPTTYDHPYSVDTVRELVPAPPEPYETFSETFSYGVLDKKSDKKKKK
jgi:hypothetical protein